METNAQFTVRINNYADGEVSKVHSFAEHTARQARDLLRASPLAYS